MKLSLNIKNLLTLIALFIALDVISQQTIDSTNTTNVKAIVMTKKEWVDSVFKLLTPLERIGQLYMVPVYPSEIGLESYEQAKKLIQKYQLGGIIYMKGHPKTMALWNNELNALSKIPLLTSIDGEWGLSMRFSNTQLYPKQLTLGAIQNNKLILDMGRQFGDEFRAVGLNINFAPVVDINTNPKNPVINNRSFGEDKKNVADKGLAYALGMQQRKVMACAKHFPGHGDTDKDSHFDLPTINKSKDQLMANEFYPFRYLFANGVQSTMVAHLSMPQQDKAKNSAASTSKKIITDILKKELGFKGLVFSDALNMKGVSKYYKPGEVDVKALKAGNDVLLFSEDVEIGITRIVEAIASGSIPQDEIDNKVKKILGAKYDLELYQYHPTDTTLLLETLNSDRAKMLRKTLYEEALTLVVNKDNYIPIKNSNVSFATLSLNSDSITVFQKTLDNYIQATHYTASKKDTQNLEIYYNNLLAYDKIIVSIQSMSAWSSSGYGINAKVKAFLQKLIEKKDVILCVPGNPYSLKYFENCNWLICGNEDNEITQKSMAEAIFGVLPFHGKLPVSSGKFKANQGIITQAVNRLKFTNAYEVDITEEALKPLDSMCLEMIHHKATPGCQLLVAKDGKVFYNKSFGYHTYENTMPVMNNNMYDVASITKIASTTLAIMKLLKEHKINLDSTVKTYLPLDDSATIGNLTLTQLLLHQAGLTPFIPFYSRFNVDNYDCYFSPNKMGNYTIQVADHLFIRDDIPDSMWYEMSHHKIDPSPRYKYSDVGLYILQKVIEKVSNTKLNQYVEQNFYLPMGLKCRYNPILYCKAENLVPTENDKDFRKQLLKGYVHDPGAAMYCGVAGHAGLFSNATDLASIMQLLLGNGNYGGVRYLDSTIIAKFTSYQSDISRRGLGFDKPAKNIGEESSCPPEASSKTFGHTGFTGTCTWVDPELNLVYVLLTNRIYPTVDNKKLINENWRVRIMKKVYEILKP